MITCARLTTLVLGAALVLGLGAGAGLPVDTAGVGHRARRVLVISLPAVSWEDVRAARLPALDRLLAASALADLSTRTTSLRAAAGDGYTTLGAGARAEAPPESAGLSFEPTEPFGEEPARDVYRRRIGPPERGAIAALGIAEITRANRSLLFDAQVGALGRTLDRARVHRAVVANADAPTPGPPTDVYHREAALGLVDPTGRVPEGAVGPELNVADPTAPFGVRADLDATLGAFRRAWHGRAVVLVEASDLARAEAARPLTTAARAAQLHRDALAGADALVDGLLASIDPARDTVMVVGPYRGVGARRLTIASLRAPGMQPGLLVSPTTRRSGFVQLVDVAPTILDQLGIPRPANMEGTAAEVGTTGGSLHDRERFLVDSDAAARFRDSILGAVVAATVIATLALALALALVVSSCRPRARVWLRAAALGLLGFVVATFLAGAVPLYRVGAPGYWLFVLGTSAAIATIATVLGRGRAPLPLAIALGAIVVVLLGDAVSGAHLELNTAFGYSPTVGIRVTGIGNLGFAALAPAALLLAGCLAVRPGGRRGMVSGSALLAIMVFVDAAPWWGQDFGGAIASAPAFVLTALLLAGRRWSRRAKAAIGGLLVAIGVATGFAIGLVDLSRRASDRTHVGRFFEQVRHEGWRGFSVVIRRKLDEALATVSGGAWTWLVVGVAIIALVIVATRGWSALRARIEALLPGGRAVAVGLAVLAVLGTALNDSGIAVTGLMLTVILAALAWLAARDRSDAGSWREDEGC